MRPALEYASFIWSPLASSASINKLQAMQNAHKTQTYNICMTKHSYFPYTNTCSITRHNTDRKHSIHHTPCTDILQHYKAKKTLSLTTSATQQTSHIPPRNPYNRHKTNMRHIHISIVSRHLATSGNNKILRTPPPHIISSEEILSLLTRRTLAYSKQIITLLKSYLHKVDAKSHPSPPCPLCNTHTHDISSTAPTYAPHLIVTPGFVDRPRRSDCTAG